MIIDPAGIRSSFTTVVITEAATLSLEENRVVADASVCRITVGLPAVVQTLALPVPHEPENNVKIIPRATIKKIFFAPGTASLRSAEGTFRVHKIYGDGNCMFRAVSYILWGNEGEHRALRTLVTHHIKNHWREYEPFVIAEWNITSPGEYHDFMISEGVFATELECTVATKLHKMNLSIYREINDRGNVKRVFYNRVSGSYETARLLFSGRSESGHYDVLFLDS